MSSIEQGIEIFVEYGAVERIISETATHKKGAASAQQWSNDRHIKIDACRNMRCHQAVLKEHIGQQQVINMTAMARHINQGVMACLVF